MRAIRAGAGRLFGFALIPVLAALTPLLAIPIVTRMYGLSGFTGLAIGQSVGGIASVLVSMGWPVLGPTWIARADASERRALYASSIDTRVLLFALVAPGAATLSWLLSHDHAETAALSAVAFTALGLTAAWYYIGSGEPRRLAVNEALVRLLATAVACLVMLMGAPLISYPALLLAAAAASLLLNARTVGAPLSPLSLRSAVAMRRQFSEQKDSLVARLAGAAYFSGALTMFSLGGSRGSVDVFAAWDRIQKSALNPGAFFPQALVAWVSAPTERTAQSRRMRTTLVLDVVFSAALALGLWWVFPYALAYLYAGQPQLSTTARALCAISVAMAMLTYSLHAHVLVPLQDEVFGARAVTLQSCLGAVLLVLTGFHATAEAGFAVIALAEVLLAVGFAVRLIRVLPRNRGRTAPTRSGAGSGSASGQA